jgi:hypothetical protein
MNIIDIQDQLKNFSEDQLIREMQMPSGNAPQFLVLTEIQRRKRVRDDFNKRQAAQEPTVAEEAVAAAGVPQSGIMGMSEAMAPQSAASEGIGTIMPQSMRQAVPQQMPSPTDQPVPMAEGGLINSLFKGRESISEASQRPEIRRNKDGRLAMFKPGTNIFLGFVNEEENMYDGGIVRAQQGKYFPSRADLYGIYGAETSFGKNIVNRLGDGVGPYQIRPTTALSPGYGIASMFPEIAAQVGGKRKYKTFEEAYAENKEEIDKALMDPRKSEKFAGQYLDKAMEELGDRDRAALAFNLGIEGARGFQNDPSKASYVQKVRGFESQYGDQEVLPGVTVADMMQQDAEPGMFSALAATNQPTQPAAPQKPVTQADIDAMLERQSKLGLAPQDFVQPAIPDPEADTGNAFGDSGIFAGVERELPTEPALTPLPSEPDGGALGTTGIFAGVERQIPSGVFGAGEADSGPVTTPPAATPPATTPTAPTTKKPEDKSGIEFIAGNGDEVSSIESEILKMQQQLQKERETDKWLAIAQAGLALMSSKEPTLLGAAGEAGVEGLKAFREAQTRYQEGVIDLLNARAKIKDKKSGITASSAVTRLNKIEEELRGTDSNGMPIIIAPERKKMLEEEAKYLRREILGYKDIVA